MRADIPTRLRILRAEKHITQQQLAFHINVSLPSYNAIETGKSTPSLQTLIVLADYFHVTLDYLTGRSDSRER